VAVAIVIFDGGAGKKWTNAQLAANTPTTAANPTK
jgi:hypothetical protein